MSIIEKIKKSIFVILLLLIVGCNFSGSSSSEIFCHNCGNDFEVTANVDFNNTVVIIPLILGYVYTNIEIDNLILKILNKNTGEEETYSFLFEDEIKNNNDNSYNVRKTAIDNEDVVITGKFIVGRHGKYGTKIQGNFVLYKDKKKYLVLSIDQVLNEN